jgi:hypothetical protein
VVSAAPFLEEEASQNHTRPGQGCLPWAMVALLVLIGLPLGIWLGTRPDSLGNPDPGGRIFTALKPVAEAIPSGSAVMYRHLDEPLVDSCDGNPATRGWSSVVAQVAFRSPLAAESVLEDVDSRLSALGWRDTGQAMANGQPEGYWSRSLENGSTAHANLTIGPGGQYWELVAWAPPMGRPVKC